MNLETRTKLILESWEREWGHNFLAEPVQQLSGSPAFIPLWNAYRDRNADGVLKALDELAEGYWKPLAEKQAREEEVSQANEDRYLHKVPA